MSNVVFTDREAWLTEACNLILDGILMDLSAGKDRPVFKISMGFPKHSRGGKAIAVCFSKAASTGNYNEIFINPEIDDIMMVLESCVHELIHAVDDCQSGHKGFFARVARECGLIGKLTATVAGPDLKATLEGYVALLGDFPHQKMNDTHRRDGTRQLKVICTNDECGFLFRTSRAQLNKMPQGAPCPCCGSALEKPPV